MILQLVTIEFVMIIWTYLSYRIIKNDYYYGISLSVFMIGVMWFAFSDYDLPLYAALNAVLFGFLFGYLMYKDHPGPKTLY